MGRTYLFTCNKCGFRAAISGGRDRGRFVFTLTIECLDCRSLYDVPVRTRSALSRTRNVMGFSQLLARHSKRRPSSSGILQRPKGPGELLQTGHGPLSAWRDMVPRCPVNPRHKVRPWTRPGRCPQCLQHLDQNPFPYRIWE